MLLGWKHCQKAIRDVVSTTEEYVLDDLQA